MQIPKVQNYNNNYKPDFGAKVIITDKDKIIPKNVKKVFTKACKSLGNDSDKIFLEVQKSKPQSGNIEMNNFSGEIKRNSYSDESYSNNLNIYKSEKIFYDTKIFEEDLPVWTSQKYSMPRNLIKIYEDYILPAFDKNRFQINKLRTDIYNKLIASAEKAQK